MDTCLYGNRINQIKSFLKKPMTLIVGLMFCLSALVIITLVLINFTNSYSFKSDSIDETDLATLFGGIFVGLLSILPAISFFILYFESTKSASENHFSVPANILTVFSIICIFLFVALSALVILCLCFMIFIPFVIFATIFVVAFIVVTAPIVILYFSSMMLAARSLVKSCNTMYIKKWQMTFFGVMSTLFSAIFLIAFALVLQDQVPCIFSGDLTSNEIIEPLSFLILFFSMFLTNLFLSIWSFSYVRFANRTNAAIRYYNYSYCQTVYNGGRQN